MRQQRLWGRKRGSPRAVAPAQVAALRRASRRSVASRAPQWGSRCARGCAPACGAAQAPSAPRNGADCARVSRCRARRCAQRGAAPYASVTEAVAVCAPAAQRPAGARSRASGVLGSTSAAARASPAAPPCGANASAPPATLCRGAARAASRRAARARRALCCHGSGDAGAAAGRADGDASDPSPKPLAAYASRPVYVLTEPITLDKLTALMVRPVAPALRGGAQSVRVAQYANSICWVCAVSQVLGIPWARVAAWTVVMVLAYWLHDFLGVRQHGSAFVPCRVGS